jgi:hypothetical protein
MGGRPDVPVPAAVWSVEEEGWAVVLVLLARDWASAMTASARWRDCWRTEEFDCRVEFRVVREEISVCRVAIAV